MDRHAKAFKTQFRPMPPPRATYSIASANIAMFAVEMLAGDQVIQQFALWPLGHDFMLWQLITSGFLHANVWHLATNMFGLWMFGRDVERVLGSVYFVVLYGASLLTASIAQLTVSYLLGDAIPSLGASGAIFGVLAAFAMLFPTRVVMPVLPPIPMKARTFVSLYALFELYAGISGTEAGVAHFAHLGGLLGGIVCVRDWRSRTH